MIAEIPTLTHQWIHWPAASDEAATAIRSFCHHVRDMLKRQTQIIMAGSLGKISWNVDFFFSQINIFQSHRHRLHRHGSWKMGLQHPGDAMLLRCSSASWVTCVSVKQGHLTKNLRRLWTLAGLRFQHHWDKLAGFEVPMCRMCRHVWAPFASSHSLDDHCHSWWWSIFCSSMIFLHPISFPIIFISHRIHVCYIW